MDSRDNKAASDRVGSALSCLGGVGSMVPKVRLGWSIAISLFVLMGDIAKAGVSNILGTPRGAYEKA